MMRTERVSEPKFDSIPLAQLGDIDRCIEWINHSVFGAAGAKWAKLHVQTRGISRVDHLLKDISSLWPGVISVNDILPFGSVNKYLSPQFIESAPRDKIVEYSYHLALGRPPDLPGLMHYKKRIDGNVKTSQIIKDIISSGEAQSSLNRKIISNSDLKKLRDETKTNNSVVLFRKPKAVMKDFFGRQKTFVANNETRSEWHFVYKDLARNILILSPGINLVGNLESDGSLTCGTDWILYGPKIPLSSGSYDISIEMDAPEDFRYHFDASYGGGLNRICEMKLGGSLNIKFSFDLNKDIEEFEIRLLNLTSKPFSINIKNISVKKL